MPRKRTPLHVVVSRWFPEGHNYAYGPKVTGELLKKLAESLKSIHNEGDNREVLDDSFDQQCLISNRHVDRDPLDPKAAGRHPYIIRAAVLPKDLPSEDEADVLRQLKELPLPLRPGKDDHLQVYLFDPPELPVVPVQLPGFSGYAQHYLALWGLGGLIVFIGAVDTLLLYYPSGNTVLDLLLRVAILAFLVATVIVGRKPWPNPTDFALLEWQWYKESNPTQANFGYASHGAMIIRADGMCFQVPPSTPINRLGVFRDPDTSVKYETTLYTRRGFLALSGIEHLIRNSASSPHRFFRIYAWHRRPWSFHGRWELDYAQWTSHGATEVRSSLAQLGPL